MRLSKSKSKNTTLFYIIKDYTKNGKRSTKIVHKIGVSISSSTRTVVEWKENVFEVL